MSEELPRNNSSLQGCESQHSAKVRETSGNQESTGYTFTLAVSEKLASVTTFLKSTGHQSSLKKSKCPTSAWAGEPAARPSSWLPGHLSVLFLEVHAQQQLKGKAPTWYEREAGRSTWHHCVMELGNKEAGSTGIRYWNNFSQRYLTSLHVLSPCTYF